jgi:hypothetical protein
VFDYCFVIFCHSVYTSTDCFVKAVYASTDCFVKAADDEGWIRPRSEKDLTIAGQRCQEEQ